MRIPMTAALLLLVAACTPTPPSDTAAATPGNCVADGGQAFVGRTYSDAVAADIRTATRARIARPIRPGQVVTMEFNAERVTITLDAQDRITRVSCG